MQACSLANLEAVVVLGLDTLEADIVGNRLVRHIAATRHKVAAPPQVPTPERRPQPSIILEEVVGRLPLNRLHDTARREVGWGTQQQVDVVRPHVPFENFDVLAATDFPNQIAEAVPDLSRQNRRGISPIPDRDSDVGRGTMSACPLRPLS